MTMVRVAVALNEGSEVSQHFGRTSHYLIATISENQVIARDMRNSTRAHAHESCDHSHGEAAQHGHSEIVRTLSDCHAIICGGIGPRAVHDLAANGITVFLTRESDPEAALKEMLSGLLVMAPTGQSCQCNHTE